MKLSMWLLKQRITIDVFAEKVGVHPSTVDRWVRGFVFPRIERVEKIKELTCGEVTAEDLIDVEGKIVFRNSNSKPPARFRSREKAEA